MAKSTLLSEYGPEITSGSRSKCGGVEAFKPVMNYDTPKGPTNQMRNGPGLGGSNKGNGQQPTCSGGQSGSAGLGGANYGCCGSQGKY